MFFFLSEEAEAGENKDSHSEEKQQQAELFVAVLERVCDGLETGGVSGKFEDSHDSHDTEHLYDSPNIVESCSVL